MAPYRRIASHHSFLYLWVAGAVLVLSGLIYSYMAAHPQGVIDGEHEGDVRSTVAAFGNQLNAVSLLSPDAREQIRNAYGPYVSEELLTRWMAYPEEAPGRSTSSPWPDHIAVESVTMNDTGAYDVAGRIILKDSTGDAGNVPVLLTVSNTEHGYRITAYTEEGDATPAPAQEPATITAALEQTISLGSISITPLAVLEDSRCPADVACIQAGTVRVSAMLSSSLGSGEKEFVVGEPVTTEAETLTLVEVAPERVSDSSIDDDEYRFTFRIDPR
jgi:hypothetical protein